jgi:hypothetical protein
LRGLKVAEKTIVEKVAEAVGFGMAMAEDAAGKVKTAAGAAVTTVTDVLKKEPSKAVATNKAVRKAPVAKAPKKTVAKKATVKTTKKASTKKAVKKAPDKKTFKKAEFKKIPAKKAAKKTLKKAAKKAAHRQQHL